MRGGDGIRQPFPYDCVPLSHEADVAVLRRHTIGLIAPRCGQRGRLTMMNECPRHEPG